MKETKAIVAKNLAELRQSHQMTQLELAEKLNYSDKAVSKWERGESTPDLSVLVEIADMFGVSLDYLIQEDHTPIVAPFENKKVQRYSRTVITMVSIMCVWFFAFFAFVLVSLFCPSVTHEWLSFIYAVPVSTVVWLVLNSIWLNPKVNYLIISLLMWSVLLSTHLTFLLLGRNIWLIYLLGIPSQIVIFLWSFMRKK